MACGAGTSGHCLWGLPEQSVCCDDPVMFSDPDLYNFNAVDTIDRKCCHVGIETDNTRECGPGVDWMTHAAWGRACGFGCKDCDDGAAGGDSGSSKLANHYESLDGQRWLMPTVGFGRRPWDARGQIHDLLSNEFHPIPGRIVYERGTCWANDGEECFGADACACFGANTIHPWILHNDTCGRVGVGNPLEGLLPDEFVRTGYRWPPDSFEGHTQDKEQWHCRKFGETRISVTAGGGHNRSMVVFDPSTTPGMDRVTEGMMDPALVSSNVCQSDRMADCTGVFARGSPCDHFSAYGICVDHPQAGVDCDTARYAGNANMLGLFDYLGIDRDPGTPPGPPHIVANDSDGLGQATAEWKNKILAAIRTEAFPLPREEGGAERTTRFDRLDSLVGAPGWPTNSGVGLFQREWTATPDTLFVVPDGSGHGRLRQAGCQFEYTTYITRVRIVCRLILQQRVKLALNEEWIKSIMPLVRFHIIATTTIKVSNLHKPGDRGFDGPCDFTEAIDGQLVSLTVHNEWNDNGYSQVLYGTRGGGDRHKPRPGLPRALRGGTAIAEYGESFMFFDANGRQFIPEPLVEWRGFLGGHSKPTADDRADTMSLTGTCETIADQFSTPVPGWPTNVDTPGGPEGDDPAGIYGGQVRIDFVPQEPEL